MNTQNDSAFQAVPVSKRMLWAGRVVSAFPVLLLVLSAAIKLMKPPEVVEGFAHLGWPKRFSLGLGITELACTILYVIPRTAVLGAILLTGFLGGATATHVRIGDPFFMPVLAGALVWLGLYLRDSRLQSLILLRK